MGTPDDEVTIELDGHQVVISSPDKVFFSERGETKRDLIAFYEAVREPLLAAMGGRPVLLQRFPEGAEGSSFFQKRIERGSTPWLETTVVSTPNGTTSNALVIADLAHVAWAVNKGCLGFHVWPARADDPEHADELRIDLDPTPGVTFPMVRDAAHLVRALLEELGLVGWPKTTGNRGIHIYLRLEPRWDSYEVRAAAVALGRELERRHPDLVTAAWWKEERGRRVFVDFNQNAPHKTVFGAWCVRARPGAQVSTPFHWDELDDDFHPDRFTMPVVAERVAAHGDPWAGMHAHPQSLEPLLALHERDMAAGLMDAPWPPVYPKQPNEPPRVAPSRAKKPAKQARDGRGTVEPRRKPVPGGATLPGVAFRGWPEEAIEFFDGLEIDNSKAYWEAHREVYDRDVKAPMDELLAELAPEFGPGKVFRPYRDVRFSRDKSPYKTNLAALVGAGGYVSLSAAGLGAGSGLYHMAPDQLERFRRAVDDDETGTALEGIVAGLREQGSELIAHGVLKTAPRGYAKDHRRVELLRSKGLTVWRQWEPAAWLATKEAADRVAGVLRSAEPLNRWLTTNVGESTAVPSSR